MQHGLKISWRIRRGPCVSTYPDAFFLRGALTEATTGCTGVPSAAAPPSASPLTLSAGNFGVVVMTVTPVGAVGAGPGKGVSPEMLPTAGMFWVWTETVEVVESGWSSNEVVTVVWLPSGDVGGVEELDEVPTFLPRVCSIACCAWIACCIHISRSPWKESSMVLTKAER